MAEQVKKSERKKMVRSEGNTAKYDWANWANGEQWKIVQGEDFDTSTDAMVGNIHSAARRKTDEDGIRLKRALTSTGLDDDGNVAIWFEIIDREPEKIEADRKSLAETKALKPKPKVTGRKGKS